MCVGAHCCAISINRHLSRGEVCAQRTGLCSYAKGSAFVLYMVKYMYTFICLMLVYAEKRAFVLLWRSMHVLC